MPQTPWRLRDWLATVPMLLLLPALILPLLFAAASTPSLSTSGTATPGAVIAVTGAHLPKANSYQLLWNGDAAGMPSVKSNGKGTISAQITIPVNAVVGQHLLQAQLTAKQGGGPKAQTASSGDVVAATVVTVVATASTPAPTATPIPTAAPTATPTPTATAIATPVPTAPPTATPTPTPAPTATAIATPIPTAPPTATPTPTPAPRPPGGTSGEPMPVGDLPGWRQIFTDDFTKDVPLGQFPQAVADRWHAYPYPWSTLGGYYDPQRVLSVSGGLLRYWLRQDNGEWLMSAPIPRINGPGESSGQLYGRYAVRFRAADSLPGYYAAWLLWPTSGVWPRDGEINFPEGNLNGRMWAFMHRQGATSGSDQDAYLTAGNWREWNTAVIEWKPNDVKFYLNGQLVGHSTERVPNTPMRWVLQTTVSPSGLPPAGTAGYVEIDWVAVWAYNP